MRCFLASRRRAASLLGGLVLAATSTPAIARAPNTPLDAASPFTLDVLMARFRAMPGLLAHFQEVKRITLLAEPLVSAGTVHYAPPGRFARHTRTPSPASVVLDGNTLRFGDSTTSQTYDVRTSPVLRSFVDAFLALLAGDRTALEGAFRIDFRATGRGDGWELTLLPRSSELAEVLREIRFSGDGLVLSQMRIRETSGDEGITTFSDVDTAHAYTPPEALRTFRLPAK